MVRTLLFFIFASMFIYPLNSWAQRVRPYDFSSDDTVETEFRFWASKSVSTFQRMYVDETTSLGTSSDSPIRTYIPYQSDVDPSVAQTKFSILSSPEEIPEITSDEQLNSFFRLEVEITNNSIDEPIFPRIAIERDGDYIVAPISNSQPSSFNPNQIEVRTVLTLNFSSLCEEVPSECDSFSGGSNGSRQKDFKFYFFATEQNLSNGATIDPESFDGFYHELKMSDQVPNNALEITNLTRGDGRVVLEYEGGGNISRMTSELRLKTLVFDYAPAATMTGNEVRPLGEALSEGGKIIKRDDEVVNLDGRYTVRPLNNGQIYDLAISLVNKYRFSSRLSESKEGIPEEIEALLTKQSCFILTAGFQSDDQVVRQFRNFRDQFLVHQAWGRSFIGLYYQWGPSAAQWILKSPLAQSYVVSLSRLVSYLILKVNIQFLLLFPIMILMIIWTYLFKNRKRTKLYGKYINR